VCSVCVCVCVRVCERESKSVCVCARGKEWMCACVRAFVGVSCADTPGNTRRVCGHVLHRCRLRDWVVVVFVGVQLQRSRGNTDIRYFCSCVRGCSFV